MNDFHLFSIHINNKDIKKAMLVLRDKPESVARRIIVKARVCVPSCTGKLFWSCVQKYIIDACRTPKENSNERPICNTAPDVSFKYPTVEPRSTRYNKADSVSGDAARSLQHTVSVSSSPRDICRGQDGISSVLPGVGHKRAEKAGETPAERKSTMDVVNIDAANILPGISTSKSLVRAEHTVRFCCRHAAAGLDKALWKKRNVLRRYHPAGKPAITYASKLWAAGIGSGHITGYLVISRMQPGECNSRSTDNRRVDNVEWLFSHHYTAGGYSAVCCSPDRSATSGHDLSHQKFGIKKQRAFYAATFFLRVLCWPSTVLCRFSGRSLSTIADLPSI